MTDAHEQPRQPRQPKHRRNTPKPPTNRHSPNHQSPNHQSPNHQSHDQQRQPKRQLPVRGGDRRPSRVRPYSLTGGRTRFGHVLLVETFVASTAALEAPEERNELTGSTSHARSHGGSALTPRVMPEMLAIVELCRRMRTVAEIAALLQMPLGVVRVLLSDLADQGKIRVYGTGTGHGVGRPDRALLERVLSGLRRL